MPYQVFQPTRMKNGKRVRSPLYSMKYRFEPHERYKRIPLKTTDKRVAEKKAAEIYREMEREREGILAPRVQRDAAGMPIADLLREFVDELELRGRSRDYRRKVEQRCQAVVDATGWRLLREVDSDEFRSWRRGKSRTVSPRTLNHYTDSLRNFFGWLVETERLTHNPLASITPVESRGREKNKRRALTDAESRELVATSGERSLIYMVALRTGLRRNEIRTLRWSDVLLDGEQPRIVVRASNAKSKREEAVPLSDELASELKRIKPGPDASGKVFRRGMPSHHTFRRDLVAAGIAHTDREGRRVDFHALRHTFGTSLAKAGVPLQVAMRLMRHTDPKLTARVYVDAGQLPTHEAIGSLPSLGAKSAHQSAHEGAHIRVADGVGESSAVAKMKPESNENIPSIKQKGVPKHAQSPAVASRRSSGAGGNRTPVSEQSACRFYACSR